MRIVIIPKEDLVFYPPTITLIHVLLKCGQEVVCVGKYSDEEGEKSLEKAGVKFIPIYRDTRDVSRSRFINWIAIIVRMLIYKYKIKRLLNSGVIAQDDLIWFMYTNSIGYIQSYLEKYNYIIQFYEFEDFSLSGKEKLLHPRYDVRRLLNNAKVLIHCEYNRAMITNGLYGLKTEPIVLPNKPFDNDTLSPTYVPDDILNCVEAVKKRINGRKVILYQGIFNASERRLDEFCEAMDLLPDDYVFIAMGEGRGYYDEIKKKYGSDRIIFIPFIRPPHHLLITQLANYGILTYHPMNNTYVGVINPLYCAPNKIFEFGKFGIPMIANDVPGLKLIFETYQCGKTISYPLTPNRIANTILNMEKQYDKLSDGSRNYYDSVDLEKIVKDIIVRASV